MSDPGDFLSRWSRRKRAAAEGVAETDAQSSAAAVPAEAASDPAPAEPAFDLSKLPSLDSIGPDTDVRMFLRPEVPASLRHAALRRAWVSDPAIRDFRAPQEMDWDFNAPGVPGFGEIGPDIDVQQMAARVLGNLPSAEAVQEIDASATSEQQLASSSQESASAITSDAPPMSDDDRPSLVSSNSATQGEKDTASQQESTPTRIAIPHRHGGALPK
jgi:hypothetical protein